MENLIQYVREITFGEDASRIRTGSGLRVMTTLRNLAIGLLRAHGHTNIAQATPHYGRQPDRPINLLLTSGEPDFAVTCHEHRREPYEAGGVRGGGAVSEMEEWPSGAALRRVVPNRDPSRH